MGNDDIYAKPSPPLKFEPKEPTLMAMRYAGAALVGSYMYGQPYLSMDNALAGMGYWVANKVADAIDKKGDYHLYISVGLQVAALVYIGGLSVEESGALLLGAYGGQLLADAYFPAKGSVSMY